MKKRAETKKRKISIVHLILAVALLSVIQPLLIWANILSTISDYSSFGTILFIVFKIAIFIYAGIYLSKEALKKAALFGALLGFVSSSIIVIFSFIFKQCCNKPILGIQANWVIILIMIIENVILGSLLVFISSWLTRKIEKK